MNDGTELLEDGQDILTVGGAIPVLPWANGKGLGLMQYEQLLEGAWTDSDS